MKTLKLKNDGAYIDFTVVGFSAEEKAAIADELNLRDRARQVFMANEEGSVMSRKDVRRAVEMFTPKASETAVTNVAEKSKKLVSLHYAQQMNLQHGRAWMPSQHQIDTGAVPCGLEGELVCYVYGE